MEKSQKVSILIVDDEEEIRNVLSRHFRFNGFFVETAENGLEALDVLKAKRFEIVITDIQMPEMNGPDLLREIRKHYPMIQTIVITGYVTLENLMVALRLGSNTCVFKPINDISELDDAVSRSIEHLKRWEKKLSELQSMK
ncbi:MAG: response regulator [Desulfobacterales bacterium]|nr:response regulator [Desulfobacterales bacterium]